MANTIHCVAPSFAALRKQIAAARAFAAPCQHLWRRAPSRRLLRACPLRHRHGGHAVLDVGYVFKRNGLLQRRNECRAYGAALWLAAGAAAGAAAVAPAASCSCCCCCGVCWGRVLLPAGGGRGLLCRSRTGGRAAASCWLRRWTLPPSPSFSARPRLEPNRSSAARHHARDPAPAEGRATPLAD